MSRRWDRRDNRGGPPQPGHYALRLVKHGPEVPACIHAASGMWQAEVDGRRHDPVLDPETCPQIMRIWHSARRSSAEEHAFMAATKAWADQHMPTHPLLHPTRPVDVATLPPVIP